MASPSDDVRRRIRRATEDAVRRIGNDLLGRAQRLAPIEEGTLRASGELEVDSRRGAVTGTVSFNTVYAARQHEETDWHHPKAGQAKYLEQPLKEQAGRYERILGAAVDRAIGGAR